MSRVTCGVIFHQCVLSTCGTLTNHTGVSHFLSFVSEDRFLAGHDLIDWKQMKKKLIVLASRVIRNWQILLEVETYFIA